MHASGEPGLETEPMLYRFVFETSRPYGSPAMHHSSRRLVARALAIGIALTCMGQGIRAQESEIPSPTSSIPEETIDQMAAAYIAIEQIRTRANAELSKADDQADAAHIKEHARNAMIRAVERAGLNVRDFNRLMQLSALDPALAARIRTRVLEREPI